MGKNKSASGLINVINYDNFGNISFVSGSTTLMQVSSSGAITTTGVISGSSVESASLAQNSNLLQGTGSVGFTTTGSFTTMSSSLSSRTTQIESVYATTGSNSFRATQSITGSLTVTGQIIAQTINVQQVTSSIVYSSGSNVFGCDINSRQTFTGSFYQTGSVANFSNIVCSYSTSTTYGYYNGSSTVLSNPTDKPHIFRLVNGGLGISANNEGATSQPIVMYTCGQERLRIAANGYTGIGTNCPNANFEVCDNLINTPNLRLYSGYNSGTACNGIEFYRNYDANSNELGAYIKYLRVGGSSGDLLFATGPITGVANRLRIDYNGTVTFSCRICAPFIFINGQAGNIGSDTGNGDGIELYGGNITGANCGIGLSMTRQGSQMGYIKAARENGTDEASYMIFSTQTAAGTHPERARITSTGFVGINQASPTGYFHVTSCGVTPTAPSWPIYNAETDSVSRNIYVDTAGNGNCSTAGRGATVGLVMGGYWDSRVVITTPGAGSGSPSDQGQGRGKDILIKAGTSDNTNGFKGGRLFLNGGMGYNGGAFSSYVGDIVLQGIGSDGKVGIQATTPCTIFQVRKNFWSFWVEKSHSSNVALFSINLPDMGAAIINIAGSRYSPGADNYSGTTVWYTYINNVGAIAGPVVCQYGTYSPSSYISGKTLTFCSLYAGTSTNYTGVSVTVQASGHNNGSESPIVVYPQ
jgi:hypothetical protein